MGFIDGKKTFIFALLSTFIHSISYVELFILPATEQVASPKGSKEDPFGSIAQALEMIKNNYDEFHAVFILLGNEPKGQLNGLSFNLSGSKKNIIIESENSSSSTKKYQVEIEHLFINEGANITFRNIEIILRAGPNNLSLVETGSIGGIHFDVKLIYS